MAADLTTDFSRSADVRAAVYELTLADRSILQPELYPAFLYAGSVQGLGTQTLRVARLGFGQDSFTTKASGAATEDDDVANTAFTDTSVTISVDRHSLSYDITSIALDTDPVVGLQSLYQSMVIDAGRALTNSICGLASGFSNVVGTTGTAMSLTTFLNAINALEAANVEGPYLAVLHANQWRDIRKEHLISVGGAAQYIPAEATVSGMTGYKGQLFGVDVFVSNQIPLSGSDRQGMMVGKSAIVFADMVPTVLDPVRQAAIGRTKLEFDRVPGSDIDEIHAHTYYGVAEFEDSRGVQILSAN
jgi:hypothetical protein